MKDPQNILVTGASSGLGAAIALAYASPGIRLFLHGRDADRLKSVARQAEIKGATVSLEVGDIRDASCLKAWIEACDSACPLDLVIANAGISAGTSAGGEVEDQAKDIFSINVGGVFHTVSPALVRMRQRRRGHIALVSSLASFRGLAGAPTYCASKAAVRVWGEGLRADLASHGITVSVICPGFIKTPMTDINRFHMPFLMSAERAATIIRGRLARGEGRIAFPWTMYVAIRIFAALPQTAIDIIAAKLPKK
jgi:short-subunit dehydrogenase